MSDLTTDLVCYVFIYIDFYFERGRVWKYEDSNVYYVRNTMPVVAK